MVVKAKVGRRRYIIVENSGNLHSLIEKIKGIDRKSKIIECIDNLCIIRCRHWYKEDIIRFLNSNGIKTYRTTGTIRRARRVISGISLEG